MRDSARILLCILIFLVAAVATDPRLQMGVNDDCSYNLIAREFAATGHIVYNGWTAVMLLPQILWAAAFIKLFGFSFVVVRISTIAMVAAFVPVLYLLARESGLHPSFATFATLLTLLSPFALPEEVSFMSDIPAFLFFVLSFYAGLRAWRAPSLRPCVLWALLSAAAGIVSGLDRQIYWIAPLAFLPAIAFVQRKRKAVHACLAAVWMLTLAVVLLAFRWFSLQPYTLKESVWQTWRTLDASRLALRESHLAAQFSYTIALMLVPVLAGFVVPGLRSVPRKLAVAACLAVLALGVAAIYRPSWQAPLMGNVITRYGAVPGGVAEYGDKVVVLGLIPREAITMGVVLCCLAALFGLWRFGWPWRMLPEIATAPLPTIALGLLFGAGWAAVVLVRSVENGFDRYAIPFLSLAAIPLLWFFQERIRRSLSLSNWILLVAFALYAVATTHDAFAGARARLAAAGALERRGIPRTAISAGFEYDMWTQLETAGHANHWQIRPHNAYRPPHCFLPAPLLPWYLYLTPVIKTRYIVSLSRLSLPEGPVAPVSYTTWLPPARQSVVTHALPPELTVSCR